ncbi:hypothetical protein GQ53DRAFT_525702 [Thozetella sp. PMI_491]|nr:hypothetical protein GQ53DRAFT_525702 [Thozetella sp. PMI_491]
MDNGTDSGNGGGNNNSNNGNGNGNDILSIIALIISLIALLGTVAQVLQQYYASAAGYSNCGESVMGNWHKSKKRIFRPYELRFEVQFEAPVIFVSFPANISGPVQGAPIYYVNGTKESYEQTRTLTVNEEKSWTGLKASSVLTADNERATWVTLLSELQSMEQQSQQWQQGQYGKSPPGSDLRQSKFEDHSLAVAVQAKTRSWDTMPSSVRKPYATTTMCHLLEIAAMMGIYWKEFDRTKDRYRAEGNGYMLTGTHVTDLGTMFTFQISGKRKFEENRIIPVDEVKEMCCGVMPTIFRTEKDMSRLEFPSDDAQSLGVLHLGSRVDIAETLVVIGCNTNTANFFRSEKKQQGHIFPVAFELLGMLGKTLHIKNSCFRMLPNPTPYSWDKKFFSLRKLMKECCKALYNDDFVTLTPQVSLLTNLGEKILEQLNRDPAGFRLPLLEALQSALDQCDEYLCDKVSRELTTMVLREHFQLVLRMINSDDERGDGRGEGESDDGRRTGPPPSFDELNSASPEERQQKFMDIYFSDVLQEVRERAVTAFNRRKSTRYAPSNHGRDHSGSTVHSAQPPATPSRAPSPVTSQPPTLATAESTSSVPRVALSSSVGFKTLSDPALTQRTLGLTESLETQATDIWCTLVFRMLAWLLLHDFHKNDVQISKSELLGSRLPVYVA